MISTPPEKSATPIRHPIVQAWLDHENDAGGCISELELALSLANQKLNALGAVVKGFKLVANQILDDMRESYSEHEPMNSWADALNELLSTSTTDILSAHDKQVEARVLREAKERVAARGNACYELERMAAERENGTGGTPG